MLKTKFISIAITVFSLLSLSLPALSQTKVVVVPLGGDTEKVDAQFLPVAVSQVKFNGVHDGFGISSIDHSAIGVYEITLSQSIGNDPTILATSFDSGGGEIINYYPFDDTRVDIRVTYADGTTLKNSAFSLVVYADISLTAPSKSQGHKTNSIRNVDGVEAP